MKLTPDQKAQILEQNHQAFEQGLAERKALETQTPPAPPPTLGMIEPLEPTLLGHGLGPASASWRGYVNGDLIAAAGTYLRQNPKQGVVFVLNYDQGFTKESYNTPTATGPVQIISESNDVLTLKSVAGTYQSVDPTDATLGSQVTVPGATTYYFNLKTMNFE